MVDLSGRATFLPWLVCSPPPPGGQAHGYRSMVPKTAMSSVVAERKKPEESGQFYDEVLRTMELSNLTLIITRGSSIPATPEESGSTPYD